MSTDQQTRFSTSAGAFDPVCDRPHDLVWPVTVGRDGAGGLTWRRASGPRFERLGRGLYVPVDRPGHVEQRILDAGARVCDGRAAGRGCVSGWAALRWRGAAYFDGLGRDGSHQPVLLTVGLDRNLRPGPGTLVRRGHLGTLDREVVDGLPIASVQRALFDELEERGEVWSAVQAIDMTAAAGLISVWHFAEYLVRRNAFRGMPVAREAVALAVDESRSPRETWLRLVVEERCGLDRPRVNDPVYDIAGRLLGVPDLFDEEAGLVIEYDGAAHRSRERHRADVRREDRFRRAGLEYVVVVAGDSADHAADRILAARSRARFAAPGERAWTLERPAWDPAPENLMTRLERLGMADRLTRD